jgi:ubiquinone/menaquinone biosynthesis C-methylase UbiE
MSVENQHGRPHEAEADRIRAEFARRERDLPPDYYSPARPENMFFRQMRERAVLAALRRADVLARLSELRILDVGCGTGQWLVDLETWGASRERLAGIDLVQARVESARTRLAGRRSETGTVLAAGADIRVGDTRELPWKDRTFDVVLHSMMISSILDEAARRTAAREMARVASGTGIILWYDFFVDNPRNRNVRGVRKREIERLFPEFVLDLRRVTLLPPLARRVAPRALLVAELLEGATVLNTHLLGTLQRRSEAMTTR